MNKKTVVVWLATLCGVVSGCHCARNNASEAGIGMDSGIGEPCSDTMPCRSGTYCLAGVCIADCTATMPCANGGECTDDGRCIGGACAATPPLTGCSQLCSVATPCPTGLYCLDGICTADCSSDVPCENGQTCVSGQCVGGGVDAGICSGSGAPSGCGQSCSASNPCPGGTYCYQGFCTADCTTTAHCPNGGTCSSDGHCLGSSVDGGSGLNCMVGTQLECGGRCINRLSDPDNCGACGVRCGPSQVCSVGTCMSMCLNARQTNCDRACVDLQTDRDHCGDCAIACPNDLVCLRGTCSCNVRGQTQCGDECVNLDSDRENCASCGHECLTTCPSHPQTCESQGIHCGPAGDGCGQEIPCGDCTLPGETCGGGGFRGECGSGGTCIPASCQSLGVQCGPIGDGCGHVLQCGDCTLPDTCGGGGVYGQCGRPVCSHMTCMDMCPPGTTNCNHVCFDTANDSRNCGGCGITCGLGTCNGGHCVCNTPAIDADGSDAGLQFCPPEGCMNCGPDIGCVNQATDVRHCGTCNHACNQGEFCAAGTCIPTSGT